MSATVGTRMTLLPKGYGNISPLSNFHVVTLVFQRARQLQNGARPRVDDADHRPTRLAWLEVMADTVSWSLVQKPAAAVAPAVEE
jgi:DNA-directed RNA polymerase subunit K/omega